MSKKDGKEEPYCSECGSADYIIVDATAQWDAETQKFELCDTNDASMCTQCDDVWGNHTRWRWRDAGASEAGE